MYLMRFSAALALCLFLLTPAYSQDEPARKDLDYRAIRSKARGREHDQIKTPRGTIFYKVSIQGVYDNSMKIEHQDGVSILEYGSIPKEWIQEFNIVEKAQRGSTRNTKSSNPEFNLSGKITITGDINSAGGILVKVGDAYYVYADCATMSGNKKISIQSESGNPLQHAKYIECAEGVPLARIQVKVSGDDLVPVKLAPQGACAKIQEHQFLYPLESQEKLRPLKFRSVSEHEIELSSSPRGTAGSVIMLGSKEAAGMLVGEMPERQVLGTDNSRYSPRQMKVVRLDVDYKWKKVSLSTYLTARKRLQSFDSDTQLLKALSQCSIQGGKVSIPATAEGLFKSHSKDWSVSDLLKLRDALAKKTMRANEKDLERKLNKIHSSARRNAQKKMDAFPPRSLSWYHRYFLTQSITWRKSILTQMEPSP